MQPLPPGRYRIVVRLHKQDPLEATVDVEEGAFTDAVARPAPR